MGLKGKLRIGTIHVKEELNNLVIGNRNQRKKKRDARQPRALCRREGERRGAGPLRDVQWRAVALEGVKRERGRPAVKGKIVNNCPEVKDEDVGKAREVGPISVWFR